MQSEMSTEGMQHDHHFEAAVRALRDHHGDVRDRWESSIGHSAEQGRHLYGGVLLDNGRAFVVRAPGRMGQEAEVTPVTVEERTLSVESENTEASYCVSQHPHLRGRYLKHLECIGRGEELKDEPVTLPDERNASQSISSLSA